MLKVTLIESILRGLPEAILFVWAIYLLTQTPMKYTKIMLTASISTFITFIIRLLPINLGINSILSLVLLIYLNIKINKISIKQSLSTTILVFIIEYIAEMINIVILQLLKFDIAKLFQNPINKVLYALPSLVLLIIFVLIVHNIKIKYLSLKSNNIV
ncbi:hypothetical protein [Clostridium folliculivorans]|uniref:Uncharacterized protein n=1 Tax=Clostridium folliculivorans TaxID=2886038 RepID=A0A9W5Y5F3_9CLOT|nr:hypothetical protein [Clostridium folliculivorans]GKU26983.1 hypothetical protein CFOLD11_38100 [Clostridium folliculivorans]GKU29175.1 hypothetical protein CFB3_12810 [Clostridium folliculivorans]